MTREEFLATLVHERFGPPPAAEAYRPAHHDLGEGGPDTEAAVEYRRRVLCQALDGGYRAAS